VEADPPRPSTAEMLAQCRAFILSVETNAPPMALRRIIQTFGEVPIEPTALVWYVAAILPIADTAKASLLEVRAATLAGLTAPRSTALVSVSRSSRRGSRLSSAAGVKCPMLTCSSDQAPSLLGCRMS